MSYNGSGVYTLPGAQLANGATVSATENNQFRNDVATALNVAWTRDGQAPATNDIPMGSNKLTELAQPTTEGDALAFGKNATVDDLAVTGNSNVTGNETVGGDLTVTGTASLGGEYFTPYTGFKNRIINGAMMIDQRNGGASVTPGNGGYTLDRWQSLGNQASKYSVQQNAGSVTPPTGFVNYLGVTSLSAYSSLSTDYFFQCQLIEGFNFQDLAWGTASAQPVTLSFWVRSSLTGTFSGSLGNGAENRSYPFNYSISTANTWTQISVTISGDTTGTWATGNGLGCRVNFNLGSGSNYLGTAGAWAASNLKGATGSVSVVGTNGATFYITGVQLEKGSTATSFDYRPYGTELALCQRYFSVARGLRVSGYQTTNEEISCYVGYPVAMRVAPTVATFAAGGLGNANGPVYVNPTIAGYAFKGTAVSTGSVFLYDWASSQNAEL